VGFGAVLALAGIVGAMAQKGHRRANLGSGFGGL